MAMIWTDEAIDQFGEVKTTQDFVIIPMPNAKFGVRMATVSDTRLARVTAVVTNDFRNGNKTVKVRNANGDVLYNGSFDL